MHSSAAALIPVACMRHCVRPAVSLARRLVLQLLWITATGDNWTDFLTAATESSSDPMVTVISVLYFCAFLLSMQFIMLNLFTMVICEAFEVLRDETRSSTLALVPSFREVRSSPPSPFYFVESCRV